MFSLCFVCVVLPGVSVERWRLEGSAFVLSFNCAQTANHEQSPNSNGCHFSLAERHRLDADGDRRYDVFYVFYF